MNESDLYKELGVLTKKKDEWEARIPYVASLLTHPSVKITAKALWLLGEMGLAFPESIIDYVPAIAGYCNSEESLLRERAVNALGRIGRADYVDYFFLQDCVSDDYSSVDIWCGDASFEGSGLPMTIEDYFTFIEKQLAFLSKRKQRIYEYCVQNNSR